MYYFFGKPNKIREKNFYFTTSTIFSPKASWIMAMVLQVKLWPNMNHREPSAVHFSSGRVQKREKIVPLQPQYSSK